MGKVITALQVLKESRRSKAWLAWKELTFINIGFLGLKNHTRKMSFIAVNVLETGMNKTSEDVRNAIVVSVEASRVAALLADDTTIVAAVAATDAVNTLAAAVAVLRERTTRGIVDGLGNQDND